MGSLKIAVDATNLKAGGGLSHLKQTSKYFNDANGLEFTVFGGPWIDELKTDRKQVFLKEFESIYRQEKFKLFDFKKIVRDYDMVYAPGGSFHSSSTPYVTMCRNMLVFENIERNRFHKSFTWLRYILLEKLQVKSFKNANGIIYISEYAKNFVEGKYPFLKKKKSTVIYHGISDDFRQHAKPQSSLKNYSQKKPFKISYVSIVNFYKHQWNVVEAIKKLRNEGFNIELELIGPMYEPVRKKFEKSLEGTEGFVHYRGKVEYAEISQTYKNSDLFIFASTCENMPNILVEAMSAGLPILSSNYGPMPEILKDAGVYMDPTDVESIYSNLKTMLLDENLRAEVAEKAYIYSQDFSWEKTSKETFDFIKEIAQEIKK